MNFNLSDERQMLQDTLRRYLQSHYSNAAINRLGETEHGYSKDIWSGLADLGVVGALFPEDHGGYGGAGFDAALVFEEMGRVGATDPLLDTAILGGGLIVALGNDTQKQLIEPLINGTLQLALAHSEPNSRYELERVQTTASVEGDQYRLSGSKSVVINAMAADYIVVTARVSGDAANPQGITAFLIPAQSIIQDAQSFSLSSGGRAAELQFENLLIPADTLLGCAGEAFSAIENVQAYATVAICAEAVGLMHSIQNLTVEYLKVRTQFGQVIGKFQVLQHRMADMLIEIEQAKSALINVAGHLDSPRLEREIHVSAAKNLIGNVAKLVVEESIQMHGGIGVTMEYELAHLVRRLAMVDQRFGDSTYHLERFIELAVA